MPAINKSPFVPKTRAQKKIVRAVEAHGWRVVELYWEPIGAASVKEGPSGGWDGEIICADTADSTPSTADPMREGEHCREHIYGYNVDEVLRVIEETIDPATGHAY